MSTAILSLLTIGLLFTSCNEVTESRTAFHLSTAAEPSEGGSVTPDREEVDEGESLEITAEANEGWIFKSWQGGHSGSSNPATVTMDQDRHVTALFQEVEFALNKETEGEGNIYERIIPQKTTHHTEGTVVEVVAVPEDGWKFSHWEEALDGSDNPTTLEMDGEKTVRAVFERKDYELTVNTDGEGAVSEDIVQAKTTEYPYETVVELTANAGEGWEFSHWEGDLDGSENPKQVTITESKEVTAVFVRSTFDLDITVEGDGSVSTELLSGNETDGGYEYESEVELTAESEAGSQFAKWEGDIEETDNPITVTITEDLNITAVFEDADYNLTIEIQGEGNVGQEVVQSKTTEYEGGTQVKLTATSEGDWRFVGWKEGATGTESEIIVTVDGDKTIIASFDDSDFEGGDGSEKYPYEISNLDQLQKIKNYTENHFVQINDIDASSSSTWNNGQGFKPIGDSVVRFRGVYNGNNYVISNLVIERSFDNFIGLFGESDGRIKNIKIKDASIKGGNTVGALLGRNYIGGSVENITIIGGEVIGSNQVGGVIGATLRADVYFLKSKNSVTGNQNVGGLIGILNSKIERSYSESSVFGTRNVGGLIGYNDLGNVVKSFATGDIEGDVSIGGLVGHNYTATIIDSYSGGEVNGNVEVGGLIGLQTAVSGTSVVINSFSYGSVNGNDDVGGLVGLNGDSIESSYCDQESSSQTSCVGRGPSISGMELDTDEMQGSSAEDNIPEFDWDEIWITVSGDYPILRWQEE